MTTASWIVKGTEVVVQIQIQICYILMATLCHFEVNIFRMLPMRTDQKA